MQPLLTFIKKHPISIASGLVIIAGLVYHFWPQGGPPPEQPFVVEVETVQKGTLVKSVKFLAHVSSKQETTLVSHMKGTLKAIYVEEGKPVKKGTLLAELDNEELSREFAHAQQKAKNAESQYERAKQLAADKTFSQSKLEAAQDAMLRAKIELEQTQTRLTKNQFIAPFDGICGVFKFRPGQSVNDGDSVVSLYDPSGFTLRIDVPESLLTEVEPGDAIHYKGHDTKVLSVQQSLDPESRMGLARAEVPAEWGLNSGQLISVLIDVETKTDVISIPRSAVFLKGKGSFVYTIVDGKANLQSVEPDLVGRTRVEISEGLKEGDKVVLKGQENIWPTRALKEYVPEEKNHKE